MKFLAFSFVFIGSILLYCTHANQRLVQAVLPPFYRWIGFGCVVLSLLLFLATLPKLAAIYMWLLTMLVVWTFLPFIPLMIKKNSP
ncbi:MULTISPECIES: hypothetical protein [Acinetobacter]|uniref:DUF3325 domain-containing protein n=2 Tax=Acinetobacter TaxID=469 RepID=A0A4V2DNZ1_9GAMM|nr:MULTISPECIES: hypothetical protein [Acinetobacter]MCW8040017.1 hypothetical protein [Acinetobacter entericus]RZG64803.1 hypothetical protein EXE25_15645 [Acinetobacter bouvetii]TCB76727.1 hypothetical protein E0H91_00200 [Acinetobacter sp. ANC 4177]